MKKILCAMLLILTLALSLVSCGEDGVEIPDGMQIVKESAEDGYIFFGPEGWTISNQGNVAATYLSSFNKTSMTFVKADMPSIGTAVEGEDVYKIAFDAYMVNSSKEFPYAISGELSGKSINFGSPDGPADKAYRYLYTYKAGDESVACLQVLIVRGDDFFIFTYTSFGSPDDETSAYRTYMEKVNDVMKNFLFTKKGQSTEVGKPEYEKDEDGYLLVSDKTLCGFDLYLPEGYEIVDNSGLVSAKISDGANIMISKAAETGKGVLDYLLERRADVINVADKGSFTDIKISVAKAVDKNSDYFKTWKLDIFPEYDSSLKFGNVADGQVAAYEYTFSHGGNDYHVFQILGVSGGLFKSGYVFTYTALESEYAEHFDQIRTILKKVEFR